MAWVTTVLQSLRAAHSVRRGSDLYRTSGSDTPVRDQGSIPRCTAFLTLDECEGAKENAVPSTLLRRGGGGASESISIVTAPGSSTSTWRHTDHLSLHCLITGCRLRISAPAVTSTDRLLAFAAALPPRPQIYCLSLRDLRSSPCEFTATSGQRLPDELPPQPRARERGPGSSRLRKDRLADLPAVSATMATSVGRGRQ